MADASLGPFLFCKIIRDEDLYQKVKIRLSEQRDSAILGKNAENWRQEENGMQTVERMKDYLDNEAKECEQKPDFDVPAGKTFSILGDSYSTFQGFIPETYSCYYPNPEKVTDVLHVEDTWWYQLIQKKGMCLLVNNSYSGSTVCTKVRDTQPGSAAFVKRAELSLGEGDKAPDYMIVFGGTNDNWLDREVGQVQYGEWTEADLAQVLPAYCFVLARLSQRYPDSRLVAVINTGLKPEVEEGIVLAGEHYGALVVKLEEIEKQNGHPDKLGMKQIADQIVGKLEMDRMR